MNHEFECFTYDRSSNIQVVFLFITARPEDSIHQSTNELQDTYDELKCTETQEDGQQRHVPLHNVFGLNAFRPFLTGEQIPVWMKNSVKGVGFQEVRAKNNAESPYFAPTFSNGDIHPWLVKQ